MEKDSRAVLRELLDSNDESTELETGEELIFLRPGYQNRILRRLRRGFYSAADTIDLHHMDVETAKQVLLDFLDHALGRQLSCVRIIHGKGLRSRDLPRLKINVAVAEGGSFSFMSGEVSRAPRWVRRMGLEWLYRLGRQPWRLRRQLRLPQFVALVVRERLKAGREN